MSHYTNPAFCLQSELYTPPTKLQKSDSVNIATVFQGNSPGVHQNAQRPFIPPKPGPKPLSLATSKAFGSIELINTTRPTPTVVTSSSPMRGRNQTPNSSGRFALVPIEELSRNDKNRYAVVPVQKAKILASREALNTWVIIFIFLKVVELNKFVWRNRWKTIGKDWLDWYRWGCPRQN